MTKNVLLCGVDGQDTVLASRLITLAAVEKGVEAGGAGTIGMAQKGGSVVSHVHIGKEICSPPIPHGGADVIIGFEPAEAVRCLPYLKKGGYVVVSPTPIRPMTAFLTGSAYTDREMMEYLGHTGENLVMMSAASIGMECGSPRVMNVALLGATIANRLVGTSLERVETTVEKRVPEKFRNTNMKTLKLGATASAMIR